MVAHGFSYNVHFLDEGSMQWCTSPDLHPDFFSFVLSRLLLILRIADGVLFHQHQLFSSPVSVILLNTFILMYALTGRAGHGAEGWQHAVLLTSAGMVFYASRCVLWSHCVTPVSRGPFTLESFDLNTFSFFFELNELTLCLLCCSSLHSPAGVYSAHLDRCFLFVLAHSMLTHE